MATVAYDDGAFSREADGRGTAGFEVVHSSFCETLSLVCATSLLFCEALRYVTDVLLPFSPDSGECAEHFQEHLKKIPPQVSSRNAAAGWACHIHNEVNKMLKKDIFDCSKLGDFYDCGCGDRHRETSKPTAEKNEIPPGRLNQLTNLGRDFDTDTLLPVEINAEP